MRRVFTRRSVQALLAGVLCVSAASLWAENVTIQSALPSPSGVFRRLITTGATVLARDGGNVGIGVTAPTRKLEVGGVVKVTGGFVAVSTYAASALPAGEDGALAFDSTNKRLVLWSDGQWRPVFGQAAGSVKYRFTPKYNGKSVSTTDSCSAAGGWSAEYRCCHWVFGFDTGVDGTMVTAPNTNPANSVYFSNGNIGSNSDPIITSLTCIKVFADAPVRDLGDFEQAGPIPQ